MSKALPKGGSALSYVRGYEHPASSRSASFKMKGGAVANKFVALGNIQGTPITVIIKKVGRPSSISAMASGQLYQWIKAGIFGGYHYAISVDREGNAIGFTHQFVRSLWRR